MTDVSTNKPKRGPRSKYWCLTLPNWTEEQYQALQKLYPNQCSYLIIGEEVGDNTNLEHLQCYFQFNARKELSALKKLANGHWEVAKGTGIQNEVYCSKQNNFKKLGELAKYDSANKGSHPHEDTLKAVIDTHATLQEFIKNNNSLYCRNRNGVKDIYQLKFKEQQEKVPPFVIWLCGTTGCGKTRLAYEIAKLYAKHKGMPNQIPWVSGDTLKWFDGYVNQLVAIIDDFRKGSCDFNWLLRILDRYPLNCQQKGVLEGAFWNPHIIIITCPRTPEDEFVYRDKWEQGEKKNYEDIQQVIRRCHVIMEMNEEGVCKHQWVYKKGMAEYNELMFQLKESERKLPTQEIQIQEEMDNIVLNEEDLYPHLE